MFTFNMVSKYSGILRYCGTIPLDFLLMGFAHFLSFCTKWPDCTISILKLPPSWLHHKSPYKTWPNIISLPAGQAKYAKQLFLSDSVVTGGAQTCVWEHIMHYSQDMSKPWCWREVTSTHWTGNEVMSQWWTIDLPLITGENLLALPGSSVGKWCPDRKLSCVPVSDPPLIKCGSRGHSSGSGGICYRYIKSCSNDPPLITGVWKVRPVWKYITGHRKLVPRI